MPQNVFAVTFSNYHPPEIDSLWSTAELAEKRREFLGSAWTVIEMEIDPFDDDDADRAGIDLHKS